MTRSVHDGIGGAPAVDAAVDTLYRKVLADDRVAHFFDTTDMDDQRAKQKAFPTMVFGGPNEDTGKDLRTAHSQLVRKGFDDSHFDAVAAHIQTTLEELLVPTDLVSENITVAASTRGDVLNR